MPTRRYFPASIVIHAKQIEMRCEREYPGQGAQTLEEVVMVKQIKDGDDQQCGQVRECCPVCGKPLEALRYPGKSGSLMARKMVR